MVENMVPTASVKLSSVCLGYYSLWVATVSIHINLFIISSTHPMTFPLQAHFIITIVIRKGEDIEEIRREGGKERESRGTNFGFLPFI